MTPKEMENKATDGKFDVGNSFYDNKLKMYKNCKGETFNPETNIISR